MKNKFLKAATVLFLGLAIVSCKKTKNETEAKDAEVVSQIESEAVRYSVEIDSSTVTWKGFAPTKSHNGTIKLSEGYLAFDDNKLSGGNFIIDMKTIKDLSIEDEEYNAKLEGHLKSADFFNVENNPFGVFAITGVETNGDKTMIKGNLTIKGIKKNIEFPASVTLNGEEASFVSELFTIDRTDFNVRYGSKKFFDNLKDKFINDEFELSFEVKTIQ